MRALALLKRLFGMQKPYMPPATPIFFKSPSIAFEYACRFLLCDIEEGQVLPCIVKDVADVDGMQVAKIIIPSRNGGTETIAAFVKDSIANHGLVEMLCGVVVGPKVPIGDMLNTFIVFAELDLAYAPGYGWKIKYDLRAPID